MLDCTASWAKPLPQFLSSMGASIVRAAVDDASFDESLKSADFLLETAGLRNTCFRWIFARAPRSD